MGTDEKPPVKRPPAAKATTLLWRRVTAAVIGAGALASAVTAIIALRPDPDLVDQVAITSVDLRWPAPLSSYTATVMIKPLSVPATGPNLITPPSIVPEARVGTPTVTDEGTPGAESTAASSFDDETETPSDERETSSDDATESSSEGAAESPSEGAEETSSDAGSSSEEATETSGERPTGTSEDETTSANSDVVPPATAGTSQSEAAARSWIPYLIPTSEEEREPIWDAVAAEPALDAYLLPESAGTEDADTTSEQTEDVPASVVLALTQDTVDAQGRPIPAADAAERLAARLDVLRSVPNEGKRDPVGVAATVNLEVQGLRGQSLVLYWRLLPADGSADVPEAWAQATPASRLTATTEADTGVVDIWVPLPAAVGQYEMDLMVVIEAERAVLASRRAGPFG